MPIENQFDAPLTSLESDLLHRKGFARMIANEIMRPTGEGASTYAICGDWGTGKSTIANFICAYIGEGAEVIRFEPWMVGTSEALVREFFLEISRHILLSANGQADIERRRQFWNYAASVMSVIDTTGTVLGTAGVPFAGLVASGAKHTNRIMKSAAEGLKALADRDTLREARNKLRQGLSEETKPLVMIIDDVDRLDDEEIRTLFRMVKACADFPNIRYLLLFDQKQVIKAFGKEDKEGEQFLDKIVNVLFDLPEITKDDRRKIIVEALAPIISHSESKEASKRLDQIIDEVLLPSLTSMRMIKRFAGTALVLVDRIVKERGSDFDPADLLALEYLRTRHLSVYRLANAYDFNTFQHYMKRYRQDQPSGTPWSRALEKELEKTGESASIAKRALQFLRPDINLDTGEYKDNFYPPFGSMKRFYDPYWRSAYSGIDTHQDTFTAAKIHNFIESLESNPKAPTLPRELTEDGSNHGAVARVIALSLIDLHPDALQRLFLSVMEWGETRAEFDGRDYWRLTTSLDTAIGLAEAILAEFFMRGDSALEILKDCTEKRKFERISMLLYGKEWSCHRMRARGRWSMKNEIAPEIENFKRVILELRESKEIFSCDYRFILNAASGYIFSDEENETWETIWMNDVELFSSYLENVFVLKELDEDFRPDGVGKFGRAVLGLPTSNLGVNGKRVQNHYTSLQDKFIKHNLRFSRRM